VSDFLNFILVLSEQLLNTLITTEPTADKAEKACPFEISKSITARVLSTVKDRIFTQGE
jgi:hypothetical protein